MSARDEHHGEAAMVVVKMQDIRRTLLVLHSQVQACAAQARAVTGHRPGRAYGDVAAEKLTQVAGRLGEDASWLMEAEDDMLIYMSQL